MVCGRQLSRAFTLIELLVVVAIIALLLAILLPSLGKAREQSRRTVCGSGMHQVHVCMSAYQVEYKGQYPLRIDPGFWPMGNAAINMIDPNDPSRSGFIPAGPALLYKYGYIKTPEFFYCPSVTTGRSAFQYVQMAGGWDMKRWSTTDYASYPWLGYAYWTAYGLDANGKVVSPDRKVFPLNKQLIARSANDRPWTLLWTDVTASIDSKTKAEGDKWPHVNHHRTNSYSAAGGNELRNDGGVFWQPFNAMKPRLRLGGGEPLIMYFAARP